MDETIGVKGGNNDRRRTMIITTKQLKKLEEYKKVLEEQEIKELEKKVRGLQVKSAAIAVPLVLTGAILKDLTTPKNNDEFIIENEFEAKEQNNMITSLEQNKVSPIRIVLTTKKYESKKTENIKSNVTPQQKEPVKRVEQNTISIPTTNIPVEENFEKLKNREIIERYEIKLKEIKQELKNLIFEYNIIVKDSEKLYESKAAEELLAKLNLIIKKIEILKKMLDIPNSEDYDQNYIYELITEYLNEFSQNRLVEDIKDSELYIYISSKLQELDEKKDKLTVLLNDRKEEISLDEEKLEELKEEYDSFDNFNNQLLRFQADQDTLIKEIEEKIANATSEEEKVQTRIRFLVNRSHVLRDLITPQLLIPGARSATRLAVAAASLSHIMRNHIRPRTEVTRYRVVNIIDYNKDIKNSITDIEKALTLIVKSKKQLQTMLNEFQENYKQYFGIVKECDKLLEDLEFVLESLEEKEEELKRIKLEQEKNLEKNNEKVKIIRKQEPTQI